MKNIEVSDAVYEELKKLTTDFHQSPNDVLSAMLNLGVAPSTITEPLIAYLLGADFRTKFTDADKYLAILGWVAAQHASDFNEFIVSLAGSPSGRRYLGLSREEIVEQCRHNQARQIPGTHYWAIMNIGDQAPVSFAGARIHRLPRGDRRLGMRRHRHAPLGRPQRALTAPAA